MSALFGIRSLPITVDECVRAVSHAGAGGIDLFIGSVRAENEGHAVTVLEYEAYGSMAEKEMARIADGIASEVPGVRLAVLHRVGRLVVGDVAVICAASAPHRAEAFRACRLLIDRIKERVPVWKREHGPDGPHWIGWQDARCAPGEGHAHGAENHGDGHRH
jgi:molybdopterin synthase catalytic subunit